jgi:transporter family protein
MSWVVASFVSALFLGVYQLGTKHAVRDNAVLPVLFFSNLCSASIWGGLWVLNRGAEVSLPVALQVEPLSGGQHLQLLGKSVIVGGSWVGSYFGIKHLPVSIAAPIRATGPRWTLLGALWVLGERPSAMELSGVGITLIAFIGLSVAGASEGIHFHRNRWVGWLVASTLLGALSGLYDKYLMGTAGFTASTVQCWFSIYLAALFLPLAVGWKLRWWPRNTFEWRWSIIGVSLALLVADYVYFDALRDPEALGSIVSSLRRGSTLIAFAGGIWLFGEKNAGRKLPAVIGITLGITLTVLG